MTYYTAVPAYGKDFKSAQEVKQAWADNKDFLLVGLNHTAYINKLDAHMYAPGTVVNVRYNNKKNVCPIKVQ